MNKTFAKGIQLNPKVIMIALILVAAISCSTKQNELHPSLSNYHDNDTLFKSTLLAHLNAVSNRDLNTLKSTLSPKGDMILILPNSKVTYTVDEFVKYHEGWFKEPNWTFETKILRTKTYPNLGIAIVEAIYKEPERNGKPYFNRMIVSYALEMIDNKWYIVKDHACSIEKSN